MKVARYVDLFAGGATLLFTVAFVAFNYALFTFLVAPLLDWLFGNGGAEQMRTSSTSSVRTGEVATTRSLGRVGGVPAGPSTEWAGWRKTRVPDLIGGGRGPRISYYAPPGLPSE